MKSFVFISILMFIVSGFIYSQQITPTEFNSAGDVSFQGKYSLSYSIGGTFANTLSKNDKMLTQGYQQPSIFMATWIAYNYMDLDILAFPNPASDYLNILVNNLQSPKEVKIEIYNMNGRKALFPLQNYTLFNREIVTINIKSLLAGCYLVHLISEADGSQIAQFKLMKIE